MKKVLLILICVASLTAAKAQVVFGVKAGANFATATHTGGKMKVGFNAGVQAGIPVSEQFTLQPEVQYSAQGVKADGDQQVDLNYVNVPVLLQYNDQSGFFVHTGPQIGFLTSAKYKVGSTDTDVKDSFKSTDFSWAFGAGYAMASGFGVNARYHLSLTSIEKEAGSSKNSVIQVGVFYIFKKAK